MGKTSEIKTFLLYLLTFVTQIKLNGILFLNSIFNCCHCIKVICMTC